MARARSTALLTTSTVRAFGSALPPNLPSADFCAAVRPPCDDLSSVAGTQRRPPEVRPTAFTARPPDLPPRPLMTMEFAIICSLVRPGRPRYPVLVHRVAALLHASFRPRLATTPLRFASPSPSSGWAEDSHLQASEHARHTKKTPELALRGLVFQLIGLRSEVTGDAEAAGEAVRGAVPLAGHEKGRAGTVRINQA